MKLPTRVLVQCGILFIVLGLAAFAALEPAPRYPATETGVVYYRTAEGIYIFLAKIVDAGTNDLLATPYLELPVGKEGRVEESLADSGNIRVSFSGKVDADRKMARYTVRLEQDGQVFALHKANVALK